MVLKNPAAECSVVCLPLLRLAGLYAGCKTQKKGRPVPPKRCSCFHLLSCDSTGLESNPRNCFRIFIPPPDHIPRESQGESARQVPSAGAAYTQLQLKHAHADGGGELVRLARWKSGIGESDSSEAQKAILQAICCFSFFRYTLPLMEGKANVTVLDTQIQKLRSRSLSQIHEAAVRMRSEATEVKSTLAEIEDWLEKFLQLTEEVGLSKYSKVT